MVDGLVPSLSTFFRDLQYLKLCTDAVKRLIPPSPGLGVSGTIKRRFSGVNQKEGQVKIQVTEDSFTGRELVQSR